MVGNLAFLVDCVAVRRMLGEAVDVTASHVRRGASGLAPAAV